MIIVVSFIVGISAIRCGIVLVRIGRMSSSVELVAG